MPNEKPSSSNDLEVAGCSLRISLHPQSKPSSARPSPPTFPLQSPAASRRWSVIFPARSVSALPSLCRCVTKLNSTTLLQQIYDPQSANYHHYLSVEEFTARFGPSESDYVAVLHFADANSLAVIDTAANRMVLDVEGPAANIENAFHINLGVYQHPTENRTFYAPDREPSPDLDVPLLHISGLDNFTLPHAKNVRSRNSSQEAPSKTTGSGPGGQFIGSDMRAAYYGSGSLNGAGQSVGLFEFAGYELSDVKLYFNQASNSRSKFQFMALSLNGAHLSCPPKTCDDSEQVLDIEMAISMAPGLNQVVVYVGNSDVSIFNRMAVDNTSKQLSCSWGWSDDESEPRPHL